MVLIKCMQCMRINILNINLSRRSFCYSTFLLNDLNYSCRIACHNRIGGNIFSNNSIGTDNCTITDCHSR